MNILFLSYWNASDPLTNATVLPHLEILSGFQKVENIVWVNVEREHAAPPLKHMPKVTHVAYWSHSKKWGSLGQMLDFLTAPNFIANLISLYKIDYLIARGSPAGALAHKAHQKVGVPYMVESFEPHADYMRYSGTWSAWGLKYLFQKHWENQQKKAASLICPVSESYKLQLVADGLKESQVRVIPCEVDIAQFQFDKQKRDSIRQKWNWQDCVVGVYAGKFGGLYEEDNAFLLFKKSFEIWGDHFRLLLLNAHDPEYINGKLAKWNIDLAKVEHLFAPHQHISEYLSVADFAFAPYKSTPVAGALSPVKVGEYWALGLPVLIAEGIGDDSKIIEQENIGAIYSSDPISQEISIKKMKGMMFENEISERVKKAALKYRSFGAVRSVYEQIING